MKIQLWLCCLLLPFISHAQDKPVFRQAEMNMKLRNDSVDGLLLTPPGKGPFTLVILVAGSGPTDMDGNSWMGHLGLRNNSLKMLAEGLAQKGIACFRYDKRGVRPLKNYYLRKIPLDQEALMRSEAEMRFDDLVNDLDTIIVQLKRNKTFNKIVIAGHSEGSLIGMLSAGRNAVQGFISISGPAHSADSVLLEQIAVKSKLEVTNESREIIRKIKAGEKPDTILYPVNASIFRENVRPYMMSWFRYNPSQVIAKLRMPVMIVNGTADLQVSPAHAESLHAAATGSRLQLIQNMNHVLKITPTAFENQLSYNHPTLEISKELVDSVEDFIKKLP